MARLSGIWGTPCPQKMTSSRAAMRLDLWSCCFCPVAPLSHLHQETHSTDRSVSWTALISSTKAEKPTDLDIKG